MWISWFIIELHSIGEIINEKFIKIVDLKCWFSSHVTIKYQRNYFHLHLKNIFILSEKPRNDEKIVINHERKMKETFFWIFFYLVCKGFDKKAPCCAQSIDGWIKRTFGLIPKRYTVINSYHKDSIPAYPPQIYL